MDQDEWINLRATSKTIILTCSIDRIVSRIEKYPFPALFHKKIFLVPSSMECLQQLLDATKHCHKLPSVLLCHSKTSSATIMTPWGFMVLSSMVELAFAFSIATTSKQRLYQPRFSQGLTLLKPSTRLHQALILDIDGSTELSTGTLSFPPMTSVPCSSANDKEPILREIVKPPNVEALYEWYCEQKRTPNADPSWGVLWPTAMSLTNYLLTECGSEDETQNPSFAIQNKTVVELGAGLGLCGLAAAALGAKNVILTDREPYALHCAMATAACNGLSNSLVQSAILDWLDPVLPSSSFCDIIVASDVLYDGETIHAFANACEKLIDPSNGGLLLLSDPKEERFPSARKMLYGALSALGEENTRSMHCEVLDLPPITPSTDNGSTSTTIDGRDHDERMKESTVLIRCIFGKREI